MADYYEFNLKAGQEFLAAVSGQLILVDDIGAADGIDITPVLNNSNGRTMPARKKAFKCWTPYDAVILRADVDTRVSMFLSSKDVSLGFADGALVNVAGEVVIGNDAGQRVPVDVAGGTINVTADNVGISNTDANPVPVKAKTDDANPIIVKRARLSTLVDLAPKVINAGAAQALVADATLQRIRVRNASATQTVAIGGAGVTLANAAIVLGPGDMWDEDGAAGAAWFAVADADGADVRIQGVKA
jgi:hypothetical protein